ncbi:FAD-dependent oxidoreductase [Ruminococcus difficilis]|uniref:FAD-dependent oxidoreductase n=1 Tax=Ruminococcus difficilis TaxID=2763069 RepID=A0A934WTX4_9FIRM|nr:FAD-dependent oxidoreductase [Ruminococcus difficilis]MBK6089800.1 FAD-dependent oxidoreductase [Ruminococcus difficilis]MBQ1353515.1 FAD-dependent oxidoreductase [Ruminococcus sp.]MEE3474705.1 FAD-dependent oxidoreductase [Ruminococcus sp.]
MVNLTINGKAVQAPEGSTILEAARLADIYIPTLCYDEAVEVYGACGLCVVEAQGIPKLLRSCSAKVSEGMVVNTESERVVQSRKIAMELLMSAHDGDCVAPCQLNCPAKTDCQGYVGLIANGEYDAAIKLIKNKIPLPASIGRVCPHPCEKACRRKNVEEPINIAQLKAFAADMDLKSDSYVPECKPASGKTVAVIGGGPAGLTAAYYLTIMGHSVTVYDMMDKMGGMLRYGIPQYRLPKEVLDKEIAIIEKAGVKLVNNVKLGRDFTIKSLKEQNDAVIVAVGAWKSSSMRTPGEDLEGVYGGIDFLRAVIKGNAPEIGEKVAICGGGNTAMDACRTAVRLGAKEVYVIYRRTRNEMPADKLEIDEAEEEGVTYKFLTNPLSFNGENGKLKSVTLQLMELGEPDASGRRKPVPIEGKTEEIELDSVILAIGQKLVAEDVSELTLNNRGNIEADPDFFTTDIEGVFAIGDATNRGASIAIEAIGEADRCARAVDAFLNGQALDTRVPYISKRDESTIDYSDREQKSRLNPKVLAPEVRNKNFDEVSLGFTEEEAQEEAKRCLECGCREYFKCKLLKVAQRYDIMPERFKGVMPQKYTHDENAFIERNTAKCILCGLCVRSCREVMNLSSIGLLGRGFTTDVSPAFSLPLDQTNCNNCGLCVQLCPTGSLTEKFALDKQVPLDEEYTEEFVDIDGKQASVKVSRYNGKVLRVIPNDEISRNSGLTRDELMAKVVK